MKLNNEQNIAFMNDPRRIEAQTRLEKAINSIRASLNFEGNAEYYLKAIPPKIHELSVAYENQIIIEATIEDELTRTP